LTPLWSARLDAPKRPAFLQGHLFCMGKTLRTRVLVAPSSRGEGRRRQAAARLSSPKSAPRKSLAVSRFRETHPCPISSSTLACISHKFNTPDAKTTAEMLFLQRPERTSENSQGQRPWKTPAWRSSPERARENAASGQVISHAPTDLDVRMAWCSRGVAPGYFRLPLQGKIVRNAG